MKIKLPKLPKISEEKLQEQCVHWFRMQFRNKIIFAIPNGGKRSAFEAYRMKKGGVLAGVPDLCVPHKTLFGQSALYIELKVKPNKPTPIQLELMDKLFKAGNMVEVVYDFETFVNVITKYISRDAI